MTIDTIVLLVGISVWGLVNIINTRVSAKYLDRLMGMCEKLTDMAIKAYEKLMED